jgi:hypothetical protein
MADEPTNKANALAEHLEAKGKTEAAQQLREHMNGPVDKVLFALREFCLTLLTAVETLDPATETLAEDLRTSVEAHLRRHKS